MLVVDVALGSRAIRREKAAHHAAGGVPVYWLLDVAARTLTVHAHPSAEGYLAITTLGEADEVALPVVGTRLRVGDLLP